MIGSAKGEPDVDAGVTERMEAVGADGRTQTVLELDSCDIIVQKGRGWLRGLSGVVCIIARLHNAYTPTEWRSASV